MPMYPQYGQRSFRFLFLLITKSQLSYTIIAKDLSYSCNIFSYIFYVGMGYISLSCIGTLLLRFLFLNF